VKLGCSSWSYHAAFRDGRIDQREWIRICADELDLDGVELVDLHFPTTAPAYLRDIKKMCTDLQLTISGVAVSNDFGLDERRPQELAKVRQWTDIAAFLGAPVVRVFGGWMPPREAQAVRNDGRIVGLLRRIVGPQKLNARRLWSDVAAALRDSADYAADRGVTIAVQNNAKDGIIGTAVHLRNCLDDAGTPWLRVCLDPADLPDRLGLDRVLPQTVQVHARLRDVGDDGSDGRLHWPELLRVLKLSRYRGFVHLDYEGAEPPETAVPRAVRYLRGHLHLLERQQLLREPAPAAPDRVPAVERDGRAAVAEAEATLAQ
jgi:sugar phosphate isomerase/epimerase